MSETQDTIWLFAYSDPEHAKALSHNQLGFIVKILVDEHNYGWYHANSFQCGWHQIHNFQRFVQIIGMEEINNK